MSTAPGRLASAEREFRSAYDWFEAKNYKFFLSTLAAYLARCLYEQSRDEDAEHFTLVSEAAAVRDDLVVPREWRGARARSGRGWPGDGSRDSHRGGRELADGRMPWICRGCFHGSRRVRRLRVGPLMRSAPSKRRCAATTKGNAAAAMRASEVADASSSLRSLSTLGPDGPVLEGSRQTRWSRVDLTLSGASARGERGDATG